MTCHRRDLAGLATFAVLFVLYYRLCFLRGRNTLDDFAVAVPSAQEADVSVAGAETLNATLVFDEREPANETLGFGAIIAVSKKDSKRRPGLLNAARLTDLKIDIPDQPDWTDEDVDAMRDEENSIISKGSALAWLGHLNAINWFLSTNLSTALIIEDDVDWDIHLRHHQIPLVASKVRELLAENPANPADQYSTIRQQNRQASYWGDLTQWEVLYLGHCGDNFDLKYLSDLPHTIFADPTVPAMEDLHPETMAWLQEAGIGTHQRMIHRSKNPLCSFAYALNRKSAQRMLDELSTEEKGHGTWSFDVRLLEACRDLGWKCWTSNPELFHHQDQFDSAIGEVNGRPLFEPQAQHQYGAGAEGTPNIKCGARGFRWKSGDRRALERIRQIAVHRDVCDLEELEDMVDVGRYDHGRVKDPLVR